MKRCKIRLFYILFSLFGASISAQTFSIKAGINRANLSNFRGDQYSNLLKTSPELSFHIEAAIELPLRKNYSVEGGLRYIGRGHSFEYLNTGGSFWNDEYVIARMYSLDIPLTFKVTFERGICRTYLFAGPYMGIGLHGKEDRTSVFSNGMEVKSQTPVFGEEGLFQRLDYGALAGGGVYFGSVFLELSYNLGLANVYAGRFSPESVRNRWISLSLGYQL